MTFDTDILGTAVVLVLISRQLLGGSLQDLVAGAGLAYVVTSCSANWPGNCETMLATINRCWS